MSPELLKTILEKQAAREKTETYYTSNQILQLSFLLACCIFGLAILIHALLNY